MELKATVRKEKGKRPSKRLRKEGLIPGVVYGPESEPVSIALDASQVKKVVGRISESVPIKLLLEHGDKVDALDVFMKRIQIDKVTDEVIHIDFYKPAAGHTMKINIPIKITGKAAGVEKGGILEVIHSELPVETLPTTVLEYVTIDVSKLDLGESIHVSDLQLPEGMKALLPKDDVIVTVLVPRGLEVEETTAAATTLEEPEVIKKGKKEETEEEEQ